MTAGPAGSIPFSTLARIEQGRLDPGLPRLAALLQLYGLPIRVAGDLLDLEAIASPRKSKTSLDTLRARGSDAWKRGDLPGALACYLEIRLRASDAEDAGARDDAIVAFATLAAKLGKYHLARHMLDELLLTHPSSDVEFRALVQLASVWQALGTGSVARGYLAAAETVIPPRDPHASGWLAQLRASIDIDRRAFDDASRQLDLALRAYRAARRPYDEALALVAAARLAVERGDVDAALRASRRAASFASAKRFARPRALAVIEEARAQLLAGRPARALPLLNGVLAGTLTRQDDAVRFHAHYYLSKAHALAGDAAAADAEIRQARAVARFVEQISRELTEIREGDYRRES